jgi:hypothetical protein
MKHFVCRFTTLVDAYTFPIKDQRQPLTKITQVDISELGLDILFVESELW